MAGKLIIHGLTGLMIGGTLKMFLDGVELGSVRPKETVEFDISNGGNLTLKCGFNHSKAGLNIEDGYITEVSCKYNRISGNFWMEQISSKPMGTAEAQFEESQKPIYEFDGKVKDILYVYEDYIIIRHRGALNAIAMGIKGDKTIYYTDISSVQYKKPGMSSGYIQFSLPGGNESKGGVFSAMGDENSIAIASNDGNLIRLADEVVDYINKKIREVKSGNKAATTVVQQTSSADELKKFKELLDMGIITQEEFDAKKKQLLGL